MKHGCQPVTQRGSQEGFTRLEVLVAGGVLATVIAVGSWALSATASGGPRKEAVQIAEKLLTAASDWKRDHEIDGCPSVSQLLRDKSIDRSAATDDPWGGRFRIVCRDDQVSVRSAGGDGRFSTDDDISLETDWRS